MASESVPMGYTDATRNKTFPTKKCSIIVDAIEDIPIKVYINDIALKVTVKSMRFISKISKNRICAYLASNEIADK